VQPEQHFSHIHKDQLDEQQEGKRQYTVRKRL